MLQNRVMMGFSRSLLPLLHRCRLPLRFVSSFNSSSQSNLNWTANDVRNEFIKSYERKDHIHWKSSSVVPPNDSSLLFTNAGMNQFKSIFDGTVDPNTDLGKLKRACSYQKCIRAGGKHNDLDDVGNDTYHHTFFEMLGNWSFADDYSKKQAIHWTWDLLTKVFGLKADRIYATYFGGNDKLGLLPDTDSRDKWLEFLPKHRVLACDSKDNFWEMGDMGPCGPCTEIHYDRIGNHNAASLVNNGDPTVIELVNIMFIYFNREPDGSLKSLQSKHIDVGIGFERLTSVLQNKTSNYETDLFVPILEAIRHFTGARPYSGKVGADDVDKVDMAYRVVADHIRMTSFAIADGASPGNEGRDYVIRRILRRAFRYGTEVLKAPPGFLKELVDVVVEVMGDVYPELKSQKNHIKKVIAEEEKIFGNTLVKGIEKFKKVVQKVQGTTIGGRDAFDLWDTCGLSLDLTQLMAKERGLSVDVEGFNIAMEKARERSRNAQNKQSGGNMVMNADATASLRKKGVVIG